PETSPLSLPDALPISRSRKGRPADWASIIRSVVESDLVHQVRRCLLVVRDLRERNRIGIELTVTGGVEIDRNSGAYGVLVVQVRIHVLRLVADQPLNQFHGVRFVGR